MFSLRTPGDDHSGPSLDVYGLLLAEMPRPIICSALLVDGSARLVWLDRSVMRVVDRRRPRIYSDAQKHRTVSLLLVFNLEMETASTDLESESIHIISLTCVWPSPSSEILGCIEVFKVTRRLKHSHTHAHASSKPSPFTRQHVNLKHTLTRLVWNINPDWQHGADVQTCILSFTCYLSAPHRLTLCIY